MSIKDLIAKNRQLLGDDEESLSAAGASRYRETRELLAGYARGRVLDVGCGRMPFRDDVLEYAESYEGFDIEARTSGVTYIGDAEDMSALGNDSFDTVLCLEVLEHVPHAERAISEIYRILVPGGRVILSVPHLSRVHEAPHDYRRFTRYGVSRLLVDAGYDVVKLGTHAGLCTFLSHQASTIWLGLTTQIPVANRLAGRINDLALIKPALWLDKKIDRDGLFALGITAVGQKPILDPAV